MKSSVVLRGARGGQDNICHVSALWEGLLGEPSFAYGACGFEKTLLYSLND